MKMFKNFRMFDMFVFSVSFNISDIMMIVFIQSCALMVSWMLIFRANIKLRITVIVMISGFDMFEGGLIDD